MIRRPFFPPRAHVCPGVQKAKNKLENNETISIYNFQKMLKIHTHAN